LALLKVTPWVSSWPVMSISVSECMPFGSSGQLPSPKSMPKSWFDQKALSQRPPDGPGTWTTAKVEVSRPSMPLRPKTFR